ncbi:MAG: hypothetical protein K2L89_04410, partial [Muribaculaceae bacterium]|nr:hypothetical protein [Muribaculaceae bacterium]
PIGSPFSYNQCQAQLTNRVKSHEAEKAQRMALEQEIWEEIEDSEDLYDYLDYKRDYPKSKYAAEADRRIAEIELWNEAARKNTIEAYNHYKSASKYNWFDEKADDAIIKIKEAQEASLWNKVQSTNTVAAYRNYISENPNSVYRSRAEEAIKNIEAREEYGKLMNKPTISSLESFLNKYPSYPENTKIRTKLSELQARKYYDEGNLSMASNLFSNLSRSSLSAENQRAYDDVMEYNEFSKLSSSSNEYELQSFLNRHRGSKYEVKVKNLIAIVKSKKFGYTSTDSDYQEALAYCYDGVTRNIVQESINANKRRISDYKKQLKAAEREKNGGLVNMGIEFADFAYSINDSYLKFYYDLGLFVRVGNYADRIQFGVGVTCGWAGLKDDWGDDGEGASKFHLGLDAQLKLNLFKVRRNCWMYAMGQYEYLPIAGDGSNMNWRAGLGFGWKHFDWTFYYRSDFDEGTWKGYYDKGAYIGT